jgi:hypothetical protein
MDEMLFLPCVGMQLRVLVVCKHALLTTSLYTGQNG